MVPSGVVEGIDLVDDRLRTRRPPPGRRCGHRSRVISIDRCPSNAAMASRRMPRLMAWVASVWRSWWGWTLPMPAFLAVVATMRWTVRRSIGVCSSAISRFWARMCSLLVAVHSASSTDEVGMQRDEAVVAELADGDPQPVGVADQGDGVGGELAQLAGPHAGAGQHLDDQAIAREAVGLSRRHQLGGVLVVEELGQRIGPGRDVAVEDRVASRGVGPVPLDEALEEDPDHAQPLALGVLGQGRTRASRAGRPARPCSPRCGSG